MKKLVKLISSVLVLLPTFAIAQGGLTLDQYLAQVKERHHGYAALELSEQAAIDRRLTGDVALAPVFSLTSKYLSDKSQPNSLGASESDSFLNGFTLSKLFSTGTTIAISGNANEFHNQDLPTLPSTRQQYADGLAGISLSQSLWKDFFGESTYLRRQRETAQSKADAENARLQAEGLLADAEGAYWDYVYSKKDLENQKDSLSRADTIEKWVSRRLNNGIGDRADLMNAKALLSSAQLRVAQSQDNLIAAEAVLRNYLELPDGTPTPPVDGDLNKKRPLDFYLQGAGQEILRRDAYVKALLAQVSGTQADEARENLKPDLVLSGGYNYTSYQPYNGQAKNAFAGLNSQYSQYNVGLSFVYLFDTDAKKATISSAQKSALAARLQRDQALLESKTSWSELVRRYDELSKRVAIADDVSKYQTERSRAQRDKLTKGRAITSDVVTAEQDAANAELTLLQLNAQQRKMETQSRLYMKSEEKL